MKKIMFFVLGALCLLPASAASVYECMQNGKKVYTATPNQDCQETKLKDSSYTPAPASSYSSYSSSGGSSRSSRSARSNKEQRQSVAEAEKALEEGKKVRLGNERNYVKYQERIQKLEENLQRARSGK